MAKASGDFLEYSDISLETKGSMSKGRLKFTDTHIIFKNSKTGKVEQITSNDIDGVTWQRFAGHWGIRIFSKSGGLHRFGGFKETEKDKIAKFFSQRYSNTMLERELSLKGWNWGTAKFSGSVLTFDIGRDSAFDVPLKYVSQCTPGKNEVTLEFHPNDDAPVSLMEMRFHIPTSELAGDDPVESFREQVMGNASIISATGDAIAIFREVQCLTPRGRYDIKMYPKFFQLHGKTFDYKIPMSTILRMFLLPHKDGRQTFFVISLDPPIKQGQTRYHYLVFLFSHDEEEVSIELPFTEQELKTQFEGRLQKELTGPMFDVLGKVFKALVNRKITIPGRFTGHSGTPAVGCSYKAAAGHMYPLDRGFIYVHKPPLHIRFEEIASVNFARSGGSTRSFDFEVETKSGIVHTFSSIEKEEYPRLFDFITEKKLRVKNRGKLDKPVFTGDYDDSDAEQEPDAYLARVKAEAEERSDDDDESSSEDDDYDPDKDKHKPKDGDSSAGTSGESGEGSDYDPDEIGSDMESNKTKKEKKPKKSRSEGSSRKKKTKRAKDSDAPKRPMVPYMLWFNASREGIKKKYPDLNLTEISKKGGELWRQITAEEKKEYEDKYQKAKEKYKKDMEEYVKNKPAASPGSPEPKSKSKKSSSKSGASSSGGTKKKSSPKKKSSADTSGSAGGSGAGFKSKEFISDSSSSDSDSNKKKKSKKESAPKKSVKSEPVKTKKEKSESEDEKSESEEAFGSGSD